MPGPGRSCKRFRDSVSTANLLNIMEKLNRDEGITFIFSTHDQRVVQKARRVITLEDGKVLHDTLKGII